MFKTMMGRTDVCVLSHILEMYYSVMQELKSLVQHGLLGKYRDLLRKYRSTGRCWEAVVSAHLYLILDDPQLVYSTGFFTAMYFKLVIGIASLTSFL